MAEAGSASIVGQPTARPLPCARCSSPFARVQQRSILIESKHDGNRHHNVLTFDEVLDLMDAQGFDYRARPRA